MTKKKHSIQPISPIYNEISSQLIVENKYLKYSFHIKNFCIFRTLNNLKAGATL